MAVVREFKDMSKGTIKGAVLQDTRARMLALEGGQETVSAGAAAVTNIAVTGLLATSTITSVLQYIAGVPTANLVAEVSVAAAGFMQLSLTNTTGHVLVVKFR